MGPGFVIIFWMVVLGGLGLAWLTLVVLALVGWKKKWPWLKWGAGIPAGIMLAAAVTICSILTYGIIDSSRPSSVFESSFGKPPAQTVSELHSEVFWFADTGSVHLCFKVSEEEFRSLVPEGLTPRTAAEMKQELPGEGSDSLPAWWRFKIAQDWTYFLRDDASLQSPGKKGFYSEVEYFAYDPSTRTAYYRFLGID